jgi:DNA-directed RNA polymerase specialized sigma24 family protein
MTPESLADILPRLIAADVALASDEGLHLPTFASDHQISEKTAQRLLAGLALCGRTHESHREPDGFYRHRYAPDVGRLFAVTTLERRQRGRKVATEPPAEVAEALRLVDAEGLSVTEAASRVGSSRATVYRWLPRGQKARR